MKRTGFGMGPSGPSPEDLEREAAAELRRAMAGSEPRPQKMARRPPEEWAPPEPEPFDEEGPDWVPGLTAEEERRAVTDLAMQQLTQRPFGNIRPEDTLLTPMDLNGAEDMRNKALAEFLAKQQRMAQDRPGPPPRAGRIGRTGAPVVQTTSGMTISPNLTVKPTMTGAASGFSPELEEQAGMRRLKVDRKSQESRSAAALGSDAGPPAGDDAGGGSRSAKPRRSRPLVAGPADAGPGPAVREPRAPGPADPQPATTARGAGRISTAEVPDPAPASAARTAAVRSRPVQRRQAMRATAASATDPESRWRVLAELADLLAEEVFPGDTLPEVSRWLAATINSTVAILLLADDAIDDVAVWPADDPVAAVLNTLVGQPLDESSTIWAAVSEGRTIAGEGDEAIVLADGVEEEADGGWAVVPVIDRTVAFGTVVVSRPHGAAPVPEAVVSLVEEVAQRVARALLNCEEAASSGASVDEEDVPAAIRDSLGALSFVLGAVESQPRPALAPAQKRQYADIVAQAATLQAQVAEFLTGQGSTER